MSQRSPTEKLFLLAWQRSDVFSLGGVNWSASFRTTLRVRTTFSLVQRNYSFTSKTKFYLTTGVRRSWFAFISNAVGNFFPSRVSIQRGEFSGKKIGIIAICILSLMLNRKLCYFDKFNQMLSSKFLVLPIKFSNFSPQLELNAETKMSERSTRGCHIFHLGAKAWSRGCVGITDKFHS